MPISLIRKSAWSPVDWTRLLSHQRAGDTAIEPFDRDRNPFQRDSDRIQFSSPFRRLGAKAQVHAPNVNDYCRTRLTHSLEVAALARNLATTAGHLICRRFVVPEHIRPTDFGAIAAAAAAAHDLGMTPLGHAGETIIRTFYRSPAGAALLAGTTDRERTDLQHWDANAQTFRLLARLCNANQPHGLRSTYATLATVAKYPNGSSMNGEKFNFFQDDAVAFRDVFDSMLPELSANRWARHPLAWLVEAADDTCYTVADIEDSYHTGYLPYRDAIGLLASLTATRTIPPGGDPGQNLIDMRGLAINNLARAALAAFAKNLDDLISQRIAPPHLMALTPLDGALTEVQSITRERVFGPQDGQLTTRLERAHGAAWIARHASAARPGYEAALATTDRFSAMTDRYLAAEAVRDPAPALATLP